MTDELPIVFINQVPYHTAASKKLGERAGQHLGSAVAVRRDLLQVAGPALHETAMQEDHPPRHDPSQEWHAWAEKARSFEARHEFIDNFRCPEGRRIAVNFTADFDAMLFRRLLNEPPMQRAKGEFGGRVGIWRLIELFDAHAVKATFFTPGRICELYPQALRAAVASGHELADHMWEHRTRRRTRAARPIHPQVDSGAREDQRPPPDRHAQLPTTSSSSRTRIPYYSVEVGEPAALLHRVRGWQRLHAAPALPLRAWTMRSSTTSTGSPATLRPSASPIRKGFWRCGGPRSSSNTGSRRLSQLLPASLHFGARLRTDMLDRLITRMKALPGVWFPTCAEVATHCFENFPPRSLTG